MKTYAKFVLALAALAAVLFWLSTTAREQSMSFHPLLRNIRSGGGPASAGVIPDGLSRLIHHSDLIVEGTIVEVGTPMWYDPLPTAGPTPTPFVFRPYGKHAGSYYTFYDVRITEIHKGYGGLKIDDVITLVVMTDSDPVFAPFIGAMYDDYLYFLSKYEYDDLYSMAYGDYGRLLIEDAPVRYTDPDWSPVPYATGMSVPTFLEEVGDEVDRQSTATITPIPTTTPDPSETEEPRN